MSPDIVTDKLAKFFIDKVPPPSLHRDSTGKCKHIRCCMSVILLAIWSPSVSAAFSLLSITIRPRRRRLEAFTTDAKIID